MATSTSAYNAPNLFLDLQSREYIASYRANQTRLHRTYPLPFVRSLRPLCELKGHTGCVNRLDWNEAGDLLASGSDDTTVKIWRPFDYYYAETRRKPVASIQTAHTHNLFGVRFIPGTSDRLLCTGSMDKHVQIQSLDRACTIKDYAVHSDRVKDVQVTPRQPFVFYSVSEDGVVRRFDIRMQYKQFISTPATTTTNHEHADATNGHGHGSGGSGGKFKAMVEKARHSIHDRYDKFVQHSASQNGNVLIKLDYASAPPPSSASTSTSSSASSRASHLSAPTSMTELLQHMQRLRRRQVTRRTFERRHNEDDDDDDDDGKEAEEDTAAAAAAADDDGGDGDVDDGESASYVDMDGFPLPSDDDDFSGYKLDDNEEDAPERCMLKALSINPVRPYEFALACGDQYVRVFDARKGDQLGWRDCAAWVTPPHLAKHSKLYQRNVRRSLSDEAHVSLSQIHTTFVEYAPHGDQMVVTYHGENVYVFNTTNYEQSRPLSAYLSQEENDDGDAEDDGGGYVHPRLKTEIDRLRALGKQCFEAQEYTKAIEFYQRAVNCISDGMASSSATTDRQEQLPLHVLYCNLAMCLFHRMQINDLMMAIFYCDEAMGVKQDYVKAYFWKLKLAQKLGDEKLVLLTAKHAHELFPENVGIQREFEKVRKRYLHKNGKEKDTETDKNENENKLANSDTMKLDTINEENECKKMEIDATTTTATATATSATAATAKNENGSCRKTPLRNGVNNKPSQRQQKRASQSGTETVFIAQSKSRQTRRDYTFYQRYTGHCNLKTDIKEATFFGDRYICSGSDDGRCFIWDKVSGKLVNVLCGVDDEVVNTVRRHPHFPILAMSGIDSTIKVWQPSCVALDEYRSTHKIPMTNVSSPLNKMGTQIRKDVHVDAAHKMQTEEDDDDDDDYKDCINDEDANGMSETRMDEMVTENQQSLSNPPSHSIDLSTLLFWANLMQQR